MDNSLELDGRRIVAHSVLGRAAPANTVTMTFDGQRINAHEGEPIVAALIAAGIRVLRTMPRTGEMRGGYCFVGRCADCLMVVDGEPNVMACQTLVRDGMVVETQRGLGAWTKEEPTT